MNQKRHWDQIANRYEDEIFDVFQSDKNGRLPTYFSKHARASHTAIDFGCGVGKAFRFLSPIFRDVLGTDISTECLAIAGAANFDNVTLRQADLTQPGLRFPKADFGFCCNVVMLPEREKNLEMLRNIYRSLGSEGAAVIVLPSAESILLATHRMLEWYGREGTPLKKVPDAEFSYYSGSKREVASGLFNINGVPTKHYLENELRLMFENAKFAVTAIDKIEYGWNTEFTEPPRWMKAPFPWDWLVECKKK